MDIEHEQCTGYASYFEDGEEVELTVQFTVRHWKEPHPYGDTTAYEPMCEPTEDVPIYFLDGEEISYEELAEHVGPMVDILVGQAMDNG